MGACVSACEKRTAAAIFGLWLKIELVRFHPQMDKGKLQSHYIYMVISFLIAAVAAAAVCVCVFVYFPGITANKRIFFFPPPSLNAQTPVQVSWKFL